MTKSTINTKIERSSLGTSTARNARRSVPAAAAAQVVARAEADRRKLEKSGTK